jgi:hypothetical protein
MEVVNYDELAREIAGGAEWKNIDWRMPRWPFRMAIAGPSGSGKSNLMLNMMLKWLYYDQLIVCARDIGEDKYVLVKKFMEEVAEKRKKKLKDILIFITHPRDLPAVESFSKTTQTLVVFDDMNSLSEADQGRIVDYFTFGRKFGCSMIYLAQRYLKVPSLLRSNIDWVVLFKVRSDAEMRTLYMDQGGGDVDIEEFKKIYRECTAKKYGYLVINSAATNNTERFRCGFDGFYVGERQ